MTPGGARGRRLLLASYPPYFRERYGEELDALLDDTGTGPRVALDLLLGSARAWLRPAYAAAPEERLRLRLLSTTSTLWVCWCVVILGSMGVLRLLEDPPAPTLDQAAPMLAALHRAGAVGLVVSAVLVLVAAVPLGWSALRTSPAARRIVAGPVVGVVAVGALMLVLLGWTRANPDALAQGYDLPAWVLLAELAWVLLVGVTALWWTIAMPRALRAARPSRTSLRVPVLVGLPLSAVLLVPTALAVSVTVATGTYWGRAYTAVGACWTAAVCLAAVAAVVSSVRGLRALATAAAH